MELGHWRAETCLNYTREEFFFNNSIKIYSDDLQLGRLFIRRRVFHT